MAKKIQSQGKPASEHEVFHLERIRQLIELMKENDLSEIDLQQADQRIKLCRGSVQPLAFAPAPQMMPAVSASQSTAASSAAEKAADKDDNYAIIRSPMVGTFYSKPNPDAQPYVKIGETISADTIVCQIEAMKMFSEIPAGISGKVVAVLVKNEESVDVNRPLFKIDSGG